MKAYPATVPIDCTGEPLALDWGDQDLIVQCKRTGDKVIFTAHEIAFLLMAVVTETECAKLTVEGRKPGEHGRRPILKLDLDILTWPR